MKANITFDNGEDPKDVNELHLSAAIYDVLSQIPNIDIDAVGTMLLTQGAVNRLKYEKQMNEPCQACAED